MDERPEEGILGAGIKWGPPEAKASDDLDLPLIVEQITTALGSDPSLEVRTALANLPNSLLLRKVSDKLRGIAGQPADLDTRARQWRLDLELNNREKTSIGELYGYLRKADDNKLKTHITYYTAIVMEIKIREKSGETSTPTSGPDDSGDTITLSLT